MAPFCTNWSQKTILRGYSQLPTFFQNYCIVTLNLLNIESPNIFHWKSTKKVNWVWSSGQNLGQIRSNVVKKQRNWYFNGFFFIFCMRYTFKSKNQQLWKYLLQWKLKAKLAETPYLKESRVEFFPILGQKQQKVTTVKWGDLDLFLIYFIISYLTATTQPFDTQNL